VSLERVENIVRKRFKERGGHHESLRQADWASCLSGAGHRAKLGGGDVSAANDDGFPFCNAIYESGELRSCLVDVDPFHDQIMVHIQVQVKIPVSSY